MDAVSVDSGREEVGGAGEPESGQVSAVRSSPQSDAIGVDVVAAPKVEAGAHDVPELARPGRAVVERFAKVEAVADAASIVHGEYDVALAREVLIHRVAVVVVVHVVP